MRVLLLAAVLGAGLLGFAGAAHAQEDPANPDAVTASETEPSFPEIPIIMFPSVTAASACTDGVGSVVVTLTNPNDVEVTWTVELSEDGTVAHTRPVTVGPDASGTGSFADVRAGEYDVLVRYQGQIANTATVTVARCGENPEPTTSTPAPTTTVATPTTTTTTTTTTTPVPQPRSAAGDGLADTGVSAGGMVLVAALALTAGGGLLAATRRRRTARDN